jgi:hypothetical protein
MNTSAINKYVEGETRSKFKIEVLSPGVTVNYSYSIH